MSIDYFYTCSLIDEVQRTGFLVEAIVRLDDQRQTLLDTIFRSLNFVNIIVSRK